MVWHYIVYIGTHKETARKVFLENPVLSADVGVEIMTENILSSVEEFICRLYGVTQTPSVDAAKHRLVSGEEIQKISNYKWCIDIPCKKVSLPGDDLAWCALRYSSITLTYWPGVATRQTRFTAHVHITRTNSNCLLGLNTLFIQ